MLVGVEGREGDPQPGSPFGDRGRTDRDSEDAQRSQEGLALQRGVVVAEVDRDDLRVGGRGVEAGLPESLVRAHHELPEARQGRRLGPDHVERSPRGGDRGWRRSGRVDQAGAEVFQPGAHQPAPGDEGAGRTERLAERSQDQVDPCVSRGQPLAPVAEDAHRVRVVDHQEGAVALRHLTEIRERSAVPVHAEQ